MIIPNLTLAIQAFILFYFGMYAAIIIVKKTYLELVMLLVLLTTATLINFVTGYLYIKLGTFSF